MLGALRLLTLQPDSGKIVHPYSFLAPRRSVYVRVHASHITNMSPKTMRAVVLKGDFEVQDPAAKDDNRQTGILTSASGRCGGQTISRPPEADRCSPNSDIHSSLRKSYPSRTKVHRVLILPRARICITTVVI